jgi:hypothetical protein
MSYFVRLGEQIERRWWATNYDPQLLPELAEKALLATPACAEMGAADVIRQLLRTADVPLPSNTRRCFGEPPLTLYRTTRLVVEVYFWLEGAGTVHQHSFSGAFQVLSGSSIHGEYRFSPGESINAGLAFGDLASVRTELLKPGATRRIAAGPSSIHSLFHLERPSATVVVRTPSDPGSFPHLNYFRPHLALDSREDVLATRRLQCLRVLREVDESRYEREVERLSTTEPLTTAIPTLLEYARVQTDPARLAERLHRARPHLGQLTDQLERVLLEVRREVAVIRHRRQVRSAPHRLFLAILLNASDRAQVRELVRSCYPESDPVDRIVGWVRELLQDPADAGEATTFGADALPVFEALLGDATAA